MDSITDSRPGKTSTFSIDRKFIPFKIHYFLLCSAHVGVIPYLPVFARSRLRLSATTVGILSTCMQFSTTLSKPLFGLLADWTNRMTAVLVCLICAEVVLNLLMLGIPAVPDQNLHLESNFLQPSLMESKQHGCTMKFSDEEKGKRHINTKGNFSRIPTRAPKNVSDNMPFENINTRRTSNVSRSESFNAWKLLFKSANISQNNKLMCRFHCMKDGLEAACLRDNQSCIYLNAIEALRCVNLHYENSNFSEQYPEQNIFNITYVVHKNLLGRKSSKIRILPQVMYQNHFKLVHPCDFNFSECTLDCNRSFGLCIQPGSTSESSSLQFWLFVVFSILSVMCQGAIFSLSDTVCYENLKGSSTTYGYQRCFGALGWGLLGPIIGFLNSLAPLDAEHQYTPGFFLMAVLSAFMLLNLFSINMVKRDDESVEYNNLKDIFISKEFFFVEICLISSGILTAFSANYTIWYLESLGSGQLLIGLTLAVDCLLGEAIFMFFSEHLILILGHWNILTLTFIAFAMRYVGYYLLRNAWIILPVELFHGITYGLFYPTITSYAKEISPPGSEATIQGIFGGTFQGLGTGIGTLAAGLCFDNYGGRMSFLFAAIFSCFAALLTCILSLFVKESKPRTYEMI